MRWIGSVLFLFLLAACQPVQLPEPTELTGPTVADRIEEIKIRPADREFSPDLMEFSLSLYEDEWNLSFSEGVSLRLVDDVTPTVCARAEGDNSFALDTKWGAMTDFYLEMDIIQQIDDPNLYYAVLFRYENPAYYYYAAVSGELDPGQRGTALAKRVGGIDSRLNGINIPMPETLPDVKHLAVLAEGEKLTYLLDGEVIAQVDDDDMAAGGMAFLVQFEKQECVVAFNGLRVWDLSEGSTPTVDPLMEIKSRPPTIEDTFDTDNGRWEKVGWDDETTRQAYQPVTASYENGRFQLCALDQSTNLGEAYALKGVTMTDFYAEVEVLGPAAMLLGRMIWPQQFYGAWVVTDDEEISYSFRYRDEKGDNSTINSTMPNEGEEDTPILLGLLAQGGQFTIYIDGKAVLTREDDSVSDGGTLALVGYPKVLGGSLCGLSFDNFRAWDLGD